MDYNQVLNLIKEIENSNFNTFEIDFEDTYINLSKLSAPQIISKEVTSVNTNDVVENLSTVNKVLNETTSSNVVKETKEETKGVTVNSPIVGTFYASGASDKPNFVKVGDTVKEGDVLCIVEAMKVMNEVKSKYNGKVVKVLVENESMVEYNQALFMIEEN